MIKCLRARRGNVHRKQNCIRGVLLFKTHFAEFCVKSVCKTEPWNWAVSVFYFGGGGVQPQKTQTQKFKPKMLKWESLAVIDRDMISGLTGTGTEIINLPGPGPGPGPGSIISILPGPGPTIQFYRDRDRDDQNMTGI